MVEINLFPSTPPAQKQPAPGMPNLQQDVNETASRLAVMEERMSNMRKKIQLTDQSLIDHEKDVRQDLRALSETVTELSRKVEDVKEKIDAMAGELNTVVRKHEFTVLERYLDLWQPMQFVTREEAKLIIREAIELKDSVKKPPRTQ